MSLASVRTEHRRIFLWTARRTLSMAMQRALVQSPNNNIEHLTEVFAFPFFIGPEAISSHVPADAQVEAVAEFNKLIGPLPTVKSCLDSIISYDESKQTHIKIIKEHAMYVWPRLVTNELPVEMLSEPGTKHTFLIRHPEKVLTSLWRLVPDFDASEAGIEPQYRLNDYINNTLGMETFILDANDLIRNPSDALQKYCNFAELEYNECMLDWSGDENIEKPWSKFLGIGHDQWLKDMVETSAFRKNDVQYDYSQIPQRIFDCIQDNTQYYEKMYRNRVSIE